MLSNENMGSHSFVLCEGKEAFTSTVNNIRLTNIHGPPIPVPCQIYINEVIGLQDGLLSLSFFVVVFVFIFAAFLSLYLSSSLSLSLASAVALSLTWEYALSLPEP